MYCTSAISAHAWRTFTIYFSYVFPPSSEEPPPQPIVYSQLADETLRNLAKQLRERTQLLKEKAIDPYATSPEISPPVSEY